MKLCRRKVTRARHEIFQTSSRNRATMLWRTTGSSASRSPQSGTLNPRHVCMCENTKSSLAGCFTRDEAVDPQTFQLIVIDIPAARFLAESSTSTPPLFPAHLNTRHLLHVVLQQTRTPLLVCTVLCTGAGGRTRNSVIDHLDADWPRPEQFCGNARRRYLPRPPLCAVTSTRFDTSSTYPTGETNRSTPELLTQYDGCVVAVVYNATTPPATYT